MTTRKCLASITSSFASIYLMSAFFAVSFFSLLYLKYPPQTFNHFDYLRIIKFNPTSETPVTETPSMPLSDNDFTTPSVNLMKEVVPNPVASPVLTPPPLSAVSEVPPPPVDDVSDENPTAAVQEENPTPAVDASGNPTTPVVEESDTRSTDQGPSSPTPVADTKEDTNNDKENTTLTVDNTMVSQPSTVNEKSEETEEDEDESAILAVDHLSYPPTNTTKEDRIEWIKRNLPESKILESTPGTKKFEQKIQDFVSAKKCRVNIYMTWISTTRFIGKRELFSLESVLKAHPHACVIIVSRIMASKRGKEIIQPLVDRGHLIFPVAPDFTILFNGTPAQDWLEKLKDGQMDPGKIPITQNLSNLLRMVILYKYGGIYLDTDMIIIKDLTVLRNTIGVQEVDEKTTTWNSVNNAVLIFDKGHPLLLRFIEEFCSTFDGNIWGYNGPYMATRVIKKLLNNANYQFNLVSTLAFYPVDWFNIYRFFRDAYPKNDTKWAEDMYYKAIHQSFGVHLWNKVSSPLKIEKGSVIGRLISDNCIICQDVYG